MIGIAIGNFIGKGSSGSRYWKQQDSFNRDDGAVGNDWIGSTWSIIGGKAINTPSGTEKVVNGSMEGTYVSGVAPNWTVAGAPTVTEEVGVTGSAQGITNGSTSIEVHQNIDYLAKRWYKLSGSGKRISGNGSGLLRLSSGVLTASTDVLSFNSVYRKKIFGYQSINTVSSPLRMYSAAGTLTAFDDLSIKLLVTSELFLSKVCTYVDKLRLRVKIKPSTFATGGLFLCLDNVLDPLNYIYATLTDKTSPDNSNKGNVSLYKCVNGVHTQLITQEVGWEEEKYLELIRKDRTTFAVYYDSVQIGVNQTVNDATILDNINIGLLSIDSTIEFDDFEVAHIAVPYKNPSGTLLYKFITASDIHVGDALWTVGQLDAFVSQINTVNADANFLLGDQLNVGLQTEKDMFDASFNNLVKPTYIIGGNHDLNQGLDLFPHHFVYNVNGFTIIAFYTTTPSAISPNGQIDAAELAWLENELINATGKIILMSHIPPYSFYKSIKSGYGQEEVMSLCVQYGVKAVFSGHNHVSGLRYLVNGVYYWDGLAALPVSQGYQVINLYSDRIELYRYSSRSPFGLLGVNFPIIFWF